MKFFNTEGPVKPKKHYTLPPLERWDLEDIEMLIAREKYFLLHAPRQTGKTSCLLALRDHLNAQGEYHCVYINVEGGQAVHEDVNEVIYSTLTHLGMRASSLGDTFVDDNLTRIMNEKSSAQALTSMLKEWCAQSEKPIVLLIDEIDSLIGNSLISVLRQIRAGYDLRPDEFPQSIILCGVRDLKDYRLNGKEGDPITGGSAFNIKAKSLHLSNFTQDETKKLYDQHTEETGQKFESGVLDYVFELTQGQPWLCNALAYEVCFESKVNRDRSIAITQEMIRTAKENLILRRETHLDQLAFQLTDSRVKKVVEALLAGAESPDEMPEDDIKYVEDLGLVVAKPSWQIANPIYQEVIPRALTWGTQTGLSLQTSPFVETDGRLNVPKLLERFQQFFREHSEHWVQRFEYKEAGPQLLLQAFLQRVINGGGYIHREYGLGRKRTDLLIEWPLPDGTEQKTVLELKVLHKSLKKTIEEGLVQTHGYMDQVGTEDGHLICFDRSSKKSWKDKIFHKTEKHKGTSIDVWGM